MPPELDELLDMLGADRVAALLQTFVAEVTALEPFSGTATDLRGRAHRLISQAGLLGFHDLSEAARDFEQAADLPAPSPAALLTEVRKTLAQVASYAAQLRTMASS